MTADDVAPRDIPEIDREKIKRALKSRTRLEAIAHAGLIENALAMPALDRRARICARALRVPIAQINILTERLLIPIAVHTDHEEDAALWRERQRAGASFDRFVVWRKEPFSVENALRNPLVKASHATRDLGIVAFLSVPVHALADDRTPGPVVGTVSVVDRVPRKWSAKDLSILKDVADGICEEIDHRRRTRTQVRSAERQMERLLSAVNVAIIATDVNGVTTYANPAAQRLLGYGTSDDIIGRDQHALIHHSHPDGSRYAERDCPNYRARVEGRPITQANDVFWRSDGTPLVVQSSMTPMFERKELIGTVLTFTDVGQRLAEQRAEHAARIAAEAANCAKGALLSALSHEMLASLAAIGDHAGRLEAALAAGAPESQLEDVRGIQLGGQHLSGLVDNMRSFAELGDASEGE